MSEAMLEDMLIWGIGTGIGAIVFELIAPFVTGLPFVAAIAGKVPWLGKALPKMFASAAGGGTDQSIIDFLKGQFSWKKTTIVAGLCFVFALGGKYVGSHSDDIIKSINHINISPVTQYFADGTSTAPKFIGDTPFGQWLQKFASGSNHNVNLGSVPSVKNGEFNRWFNSLTPDEFDQVWADPNLRKTIRSRLRHPGGLHEWLLVSRTPTFKRWGVTAEQIKELRTAISDVNFVNPKGAHGRKGSTKAHNELLEIIDSSPDYNTFKRRLQNWANYRLEGGAESLPRGLRP